MNVRADDLSISWGSVSDRSTSASFEGRLALLAPRPVPFGFVLGQLEGREAVEVDERRVRLIGNVEAAQERLLREPRGQRRQSRKVRRDLQRLVHQLRV